ncbi:MULTISPECIES: hypothetical protein [Shimia]|uniref:hypothetical protein n=1 Tax=Shimia TaxID=573139 RepID=UPI001FB3E9E0|nr:MULTISPECIES: hypothetical protein [Shimia]MDV4143416.1 hypothetical protein [Shimia sp. FJ5]
MGLHVLVQLGLFFLLTFAGIGVLLVGLGVMKWGNGQELRHSGGAAKDGKPADKT